MDPWKLNVDNGTVSDNNRIFTFEDDFKPFRFEKLPDSKQYLALLDSKLKKIKSDPNFLKQLSEKRAQCMQELLSNIADFSIEDLELETPVNQSSLLKTLAPERQALTQGELVHLIKGRGSEEEE